MASSKPIARMDFSSGNAASSFEALPITTTERLALSSTASTHPIPAPPLPVTSLEVAKPQTVFYLAYGSNLAASVFRGVRAIRPLSAVNVHVPSLDLTFDLSFMPYTEPCFANTALRKLPPAPKPPQPPAAVPPPSSASTSTAFPPERTWDLGLVGVVYELTLEDFAQVIRTEGGGASYTDILVPCFAIPKDVKSIPALPTGMPFLAHTLFAPFPKKHPGAGPKAGPKSATSLISIDVVTVPDATFDGRKGSIDGASLSEKCDASTVEGEALLGIATAPLSAFDPLRQHRSATGSSTSRVPVSRPHADYAQPSPRYLNLITTGAAERGLPADYQAYLQSLHTYRVTTRGQAVGAWIVLNVWRRAMSQIGMAGQRYADEKGRWPWWVVKLLGWLFASLWFWYDSVGKRVLGEGERTIGDPWEGKKDEEV